MPGCAGHEAGVQQTLGLELVRQVSPDGQSQGMLPPQPSLNDPHSCPPVLGPEGTFSQVYGTPVGLLQRHVPVCPGVVVEHTRPVPQPQLMTPPMPSGSWVPHWPLYVLLHVALAFALTGSVGGRAHVIAAPAGAVVAAAARARRAAPGIDGRVHRVADGPLTTAARARRRRAAAVTVHALIGARAPIARARRPRSARVRDDSTRPHREAVARVGARAARAGHPVGRRCPRGARPVVHAFPVRTAGRREVEPHPLVSLVPHCAARSTTPRAARSSSPLAAPGAGAAPPSSVHVPDEHPHERLLVPHLLGSAPRTCPHSSRRRCSRCSRSWSPRRRPRSRSSRTRASRRNRPRTSRTGTLRSRRKTWERTEHRRRCSDCRPARRGTPRSGSSSRRRRSDPPQLRPSARHSSGCCFVSQRLAMPRTPQLSPSAHPKPATPSQETVPPHPSEMVPHSTPLFALAAAQSSAALFGVQLGSHVWKTALQTRAPPSASAEQPPQSV